jgi:hypothetical protein
MKQIILLVSIVIIFISCKKMGNGNDCGAAQQVVVTSNSPVIEGWPIYLSTTATMGDMFHWTGPNGWDINYQFYASDANSQQRANATLADAGLYKVDLRNADGCVEYSGSVDVKVIPAPSAPCSLTNNTSTTTVVGVGGSTYTNIYFQSSTYYTVQATTPGESLTFYFIGNVPPKPGIYKSSGYGPTNETEVGCWISKFPYDFINEPGQDVYVTRVNGKTQVAFCNCTFTNPLGSTKPKISAKIVQP